MLLVTIPLLGVMCSPVSISTLRGIIPPSLYFRSALLLFFLGVSSSTAFATVTGFFESGLVANGESLASLLQKWSRISASAQSLESPRGCVAMSRILVTGRSSKETEAALALVPEDILGSSKPDFPGGLPLLADSSPPNRVASSNQEYGNPSWKCSQICSKQQFRFRVH